MLVRGFDKMTLTLIKYRARTVVVPLTICTVSVNMVNFIGTCLKEMEIPGPK